MLGIVCLESFNAERRGADWSEHRPVKDYTSFVVIYSDEIYSRLRKRYGWEPSAGAARYMQQVLVELPENVYYGMYSLSGNQPASTLGFYTPREAYPGASRMVTIQTGELINMRDYDSPEDAFAAAIESGIYAEITQPDGSFQSHKLRVLATSGVRNSDEDPWQKGTVSLREMRTAVGMTQQQLADRAGITLRQLQRIESGETEPCNASAGTIVKIADAIGVDVHCIVR